jgi:CheY-like chemotaxis protein
MNQRKKLLLVDDSKTILLMERMILGNGRFDLVTAVNGDLGYDAIEAASAEAALAGIELHLPDAVLLDALIPQLHGRDLWQAVRNNHETQNTRVIVMTGPFKAPRRSRRLPAQARRSRRAARRPRPRAQRRAGSGIRDRGVR